MYQNPRNPQQTELEFVDFETPFSRQLRKDNRWVRLSNVIPWSEYEPVYQDRFGSTGNPAIAFRVALGSLVIKERLGLTDRETVEQIRENPYLQYFIGFDRYRDEEPFDASSMVHFRKRIDMGLLVELNERLCGVRKDPTQEQDCKKRDDDDASGTGSVSEGKIPPATSEEQPPALLGKLIIDATCAPEDIRYPTDVGILNEAREITELLIDKLWDAGPHSTSERKPRSYRRKARSAYLSFIRHRRPNWRRIRKALRRQLGFVGRNLKTISALVEAGSLSALDQCTYRKLLIVAEVYRQQSVLYGQGLLGERRSMPDRIVSISKPHIRPIIRGKASAETEFGSKLSVSVIEGKAYLDRLSWDAYNEGGDLKVQAEAFHRRTGHYPVSIHADKVYRTRDNLGWCKARGIRLSGPALGRPPANETICKAVLREQRQDEITRIEIEGVFGRAKRRFSLDKIMMRLRETSEHAIALVFLVMNMEKILRDLFCRLFWCAFVRWNQSGGMLIRAKICLG